MLLILKLLACDIILANHNWCEWVECHVGSNVVIITWSASERFFGTDRGVLGRSLKIGGEQKR